jgi:uncharacterized protein (DUF58 family)
LILLILHFALLFIMSVVSRYLEPAMIERLNHLQLSARSVVEGSTIGQHRSPVKGASIEFRQHRAYVAGDELRRLDWRVLGRTDRPFIKEYDEETNLRCVLMLDCSGSMAYGGKSGTKFDYAGKLVAALGYLMLGQTESVGVGLFGKKLEQWLAPHGGTGQLARVIDVLERAVARGESSAKQAMRDVADRLGRRALVIIVSDCFAPVNELRTGLARLRHDRHEVIVLQVLDADEVAFPFKTWSRFRGLEGERPQVCEPALVRKIYLDNFRRHRAALEQSCRALAVEFHSFETSRPVIDSLTGFLHRRAMKK